jgi:hypothetical protein
MAIADVLHERLLGAWTDTAIWYGRSDGQRLVLAAYFLVAETDLAAAWKAADF